MVARVNEAIKQRSQQAPNDIVTQCFEWLDKHPGALDVSDADDDDDDEDCILRHGVHSACLCSSVVGAISDSFTCAYIHVYIYTYIYIRILIEILYALRVTRRPMRSPAVLGILR